MAETRLIVTNPTGLHARPAAIFVRAAASFTSAIKVRNLSRGVKEADAKSLLSLMMLGITQGHEVLISAEGVDADEAIERLSRLLKSNFEEAIG